MSKKILIIAGTRPEAIKVSPLVLEMLKYPNDFEVVVRATGQHYRSNIQPIFDFFQIPRKNIKYSISDASLDDLYLDVDAITKQFKPDLLMVQGDTTSAMAGALVAHDRGIRLGHIESGLRTHDLKNPHPEEGYRMMIDSISDIRYCPTLGNAKNVNLLTNGVNVVTGNTGVDACNYAMNFPKSPRTHHNKVLITLHRRETIEDPIKLWFIRKTIISACDRWSGTLFVLIKHHNPHCQPLYASLEKLQIRNLMIIDPLPYQRMVENIHNSLFVMTDSGGVQEDAATLGVPQIILRDKTERPESTPTIAGTNPIRIANSVEFVMNNMHCLQIPTNPFGNGLASENITTHLLSYL